MRMMCMPAFQGTSAHFERAPVVRELKLFHVLCEPNFISLACMKYAAKKPLISGIRKGKTPDNASSAALKMCSALTSMACASVQAS